MHSQTNDTKRTMDLLFDQIYHGWWYYSCAKKLDSLFRERKIESTFYFFLAAYLACVDDTVILMAKVARPHGKSITIYSLLKIADDHPDYFKLAKPNDLRKLTKGCRADLKNYKALLNIIGDQRNLIIAHLGREHIEDPQKILSLPMIDMNELERCYQELLNILNVFSGFCDGSEYVMNILDEGIEQDIDFIMSRISK